MNKASGFQNKLQTLYQFIFEKAPDGDRESVYDLYVQGISEKGKNALSLFYSIFAEQKDFLKCLYDIKLPGELAVESNILLISREQQGVCAYGMEVDTGRVIYLDDTNGIAEPLNTEIEDFLLWQIAMQCLGFCECTGQIEDCFDSLNAEHHSLKLTAASESGAVYYFSEGVLLAVDGDIAYVSAKDDEAMEAFEANTGFDVDYY